ncbi:ABC transporter ATP-binding protein [Desulfococcaceae bacterium HSG8]|nr:ABC transporter ATP-binding protein [Desulfococcaceae bacterium HSG8]
MESKDVSFLEQIQYIGKYLRPHKRILIFSFLLSGVSTALGMIQPYFAKILIDKVFIDRQSQILIPLLLALISLLIISFIIRVSNSYIYTLYSSRILFKMREDLFEHLQRIPLNFFTKRKIGDIFSRIASDMADVQALVTETIPHYLFNFLTCLITAMILFWLNWKMALLSLSFLPAALYIIHRIRPKIMELSRHVAESNADIAHFLFESLSNTSLIRAFGAETPECEKLKEKQSGILKFLLRYQIMGVFSGSVPTMFTVINTLVVFGYGGFLVLEDTLSIGSLVAFSVYQGRVFAPLQGLMDGFLVIQKSRVSLTRVREILDIEPVSTENGDHVPEDGAVRGDIAFKNVSFAYDENEPVLRNLSFQIPSGKITALVGPSGVGKTTICHLILKLFDPDSGQVTLDGTDLNRFRTGWLRKQITLVSQDIFLFHTSILENIRFSDPRASNEAIEAAAKAACIHEFILSLPDGYHTVVGDRGVRLSGGQKQRISIARSILLDPKILILDEATAFLDASVEERLKETIKFLMKDRTILIVSHRFSTIQHADKIIAFEKEGLVYEDTAEAYLNES